MLPPAGPFGSWQAADHPGMAYALLALLGMFAFVLCFLGLYRMAARGEVTVRQVAFTAVLWCAPVLLAHPLLSMDAYSYAAQGEMAARGLDPYRLGPSVLGPGPLTYAVAPIWRNTPAPYGPLTLAILQRAAELTGAELVPFVYLLRALAAAAVAACGLVAVRLAKPGRAAVVLALVVANPVTVFHLIGGVHLDALLAACAGLTVLAVRRGRWGWATVAAATALALKLPGIILIGYVVISRMRPEHRRKLAGAAGVLAGAAGVLAVYSSMVPDGIGWIGVLDTPGKVRMFYALPTVVGGILYAVTHLGGSAVEFTETLSWGRAVCGLAGAAGIVALLLRARTEPHWRRPAALAGAALVVLALSAPAVHAWYLVWGLVPIAAGAASVGRRWIVLLCVAVSFTAMPSVIQHGAGLALILVLLAVALAAGFAATSRRPDDAFPRLGPPVAPVRAVTGS